MVFNFPFGVHFLKASSSAFPLIKHTWALLKAAVPPYTLSLISSHSHGVLISFLQAGPPQPPPPPFPRDPGAEGSPAEATKGIPEAEEARQDQWVGGQGVDIHGKERFSTGFLPHLKLVCDLYC